MVDIHTSPHCSCTGQTIKSYVSFQGYYLKKFGQRKHQMITNTYVYKYICKPVYCRQWLKTLKSYQLSRGLGHSISSYWSTDICFLNLVLRREHSTRIIRTQNQVLLTKTGIGVLYHSSLTHASSGDSCSTNADVILYLHLIFFSTKVNIPRVFHMVTIIYRRGTKSDLYITVSSSL